MGSEAASLDYIAPGLRPLAVTIESLTPDPANARTHSERNIEAIRNSLTRFGQRKPIVVQQQGDARIIRAGNGSVEAAKALGWSHVAAVVVEEDSADAIQFAIADNRTAELATWDNEVLHRLLADMPDTDRIVAGFDDTEWSRLQGRVAPVTQDTSTVLAGDPVTRTGDIWSLGRHRVVCGDSTDADTVARLLGDAVPILMVTDPPYGVNYDPEWRNEAAAKGQLAYAARRVGKVRNDDRSDWSAAWSLFPGDVVYCWSAAGALQIDSAHSLTSSGFELRNQIIWKKPHFPISQGHYTYQHEPCWYAVRKGSHAHWIGDGTASSVWEVSLDANVIGGHSTQKPVEIMARPIRNHASPDVYDPFLGSGTTLVASEQLDRRCFGAEIDPAYCDVIVRRWESLTDQKATRVDSDGKEQPPMPDAPSE